MHKIRNRCVQAGTNGRKKNHKKYLHPKTISMGEFSARTALGVSPAMKEKENYVVSVLF